MQWRETVSMGVPGGDHGAGALPPPAPGAEAGALQGIFQGAPLGAGQGHQAALHDMCREAPPYRLGPAPVHPIRCRRMIKIIKILWDVNTNATWFQTVVT